jgi:short-subunit dehydrogenase
MDMSRYPAWVWTSAHNVVAESLAALRRRRPVVVIPGLGNRAAVLALRYTPRWLWRLAIGRLRRERARP